MRWLVLAVLTVNLVYFGWELDSDMDRYARNTGTALPVPASASRLGLIRELDNPPPARSTQDTIDTVNAAGSASGGSPSLASELVKELPDIRPAGPRSQLARPVCFTYGPLPEQDQATGLNDWFRSRNARTRIRRAAGGDREFFWIYLAPQGSREGALEVLQDLRDKGISDYRLVRRGTLRNAVSLGIFSSQSAVNQRLAELQDKGYKPVVVPYTGVDTIYRVDVRFDTLAGDMEEIIKGYPSRFNSVPVDCNEIDIAGAEP